MDGDKYSWQDLNSSTCTPPAFSQSKQKFISHDNKMDVKKRMLKCTRPTTIFWRVTYSYKRKYHCQCTNSVSVFSLCRINRNIFCYMLFITRPRSLDNKSFFFFWKLAINKRYPCFIYAWPGQYRIFYQKFIFLKLYMQYTERHLSMDKTPYMAERRFQAFLEMLILVIYTLVLEHKFPNKCISHILIGES